MLKASPPWRCHIFFCHDLAKCGRTAEIRDSVLGSYLLQAFVQEADVDRDTSVTMEEVVNFSNFQFMEEQQDVVLILGELVQPFVYLSYEFWGKTRRGYGREKRVEQGSDV